MRFARCLSLTSPPTELRLVQGSPEWQKLRERALSDLFWFCDFVLGYGKLVPMTLGAHYLMCRFAERKTGSALLDEAHFRLISVPRGVGKTTLATIGRAIQYALQVPNAAILIANERQENANKFLAEIRLQFESNGLLRALFPDKIPQDVARHQPWAMTEASLLRDAPRKEPTFSTIGVGGTVTGMHFGLILADDVISREAMENARAGSWQIMEKTNRWINQLQPLLDFGAPHPEIVFTGTRWWIGDSYEHIERAFGYGDEKRRVLLKVKLDNNSTQTLEDVYRVGDLAVFRRPIIENGACFFPEKYTMEQLAKIRVTDAALFAANFMNSPADDVTAEFKQEWLRYFNWATPKVLRFHDAEGKERFHDVEDLDCVVSVDPAFSEGADNPSRQALVVTGSTADGCRLLLQARASLESLDAYIKEIVLAVRTYRPRKLLIEKVAQQAAFIKLVREALQRADIAVSLEEVTPGGRKKEARIQTLTPYFQRGQVFVERGQHDFLTEYGSFPRGERKDLLDALAYQPPFWRAPLGAADATSFVAGNRSRVERELSSLYERMGREAPQRAALKRESWRFREDGSRR